MFAFDLNGFALGFGKKEKIAFQNYKKKCPDLIKMPDQRKKIMEKKVLFVVSVLFKFARIH